MGGRGSNSSKITLIEYQHRNLEKYNKKYKFDYYVDSHKYPSFLRKT